ncbi:MAG: ComEC/Rec2 family competence protein [Candidatus Peribacteraceae bacterium]|nr:ComEC/Rec2 family competence protein [Candidatus Peribacteraceae bacterium]
MPPKRFLWATLAFSAGLLVLAAHEYSLLPDGQLHVHLLDVGQGDALLLTTPSGKQIVIDGGPDLSLLEHLGARMPFFDRTIELLVLTHPDADHISALPEILKRYRVERMLLSGIQYDSSRYAALLAGLERSRIPILLPEPRSAIAMGDGVVLEVLWPIATDAFARAAGSNETSIVLLARYGEQSILCTGDIETAQEADLLASGTDVRSTVLKAPHHGSRTSSSTGFLLAVQPEVALISAGRENQFGHPHFDILERYGHLAIPVRSTAHEGTISLKFTGKNAPSL